MIGDALLLAWLTGRSLARSLPPPIADHGGFRVDTRSETEDARWVFPSADRRIATLAETIASPRLRLKACASAGELASVLPPNWRVDGAYWFMRSIVPPPPRQPPAGYGAEIDRVGPVSTVRIIAPDGTLAASGHAAETPDAFVYDRIETMADHRRKGLGHAVMARLHACKVDPTTPQLLVATEAGRALYSRLGWTVFSPYATASFTPA